MKIEIISQGRITPEAAGAYQSFPTLARVDENRLLVGFRQGRVTSDWDPETGSHGGEGDIHLIDSPDDGRTFGAPRLAVAHEPRQTNEMDAILSRIGKGRVALITRSHGPRVFTSYWAVSRDGGQTFSERTPFDWQGRLLAVFGHLVPAEGGGWLTSFYTRTEDGSLMTGVGRLRLDGSPLEVAGWIQQGELDDTELNETALLRLKSGRLLAVIRQEPCLEGLFRAFSEDDGRTWSDPEPIGLFGEAPNLLALPDGRILIIYRGLSRWSEECFVSLGLSEDEGQTWPRSTYLDVYDGGQYHGGYGDLVNTQDGGVLAVYYRADRGRPPMVCQSRFRLLD